MRKYLQLTKMFIQEEIQSPINVFLNLFLSSIGIIVIMILWKAVFETHAAIYGITYEEMIRYYLAVLIVGKLIKSGSDDFFKEKVESGDISSDLIKPINYILYLLTRTIAKILVYFSGLLIITITLALIINVAPVSNLVNLIYSLLPIILAFALGFFVTISVSSFHFFYPEIQFFSFLVRDMCIGILAGVFFNLELLTGTVYKIFNILPFKYIINFPAVILSSDIKMRNIVDGILLQLIWVMIMGLSSIYLFKSGLRKYNTYGG